MSLVLDSRIVIDEKIKGGRPCLAGHRIAVQDVVIWHERLGMAVDSIAAEYSLTLTDIYIALAFYYANREAIDQSIQADSQLAEAMRKKLPPNFNKSSQRLAAIKFYTDENVAKTVVKGLCGHEGWMCLPVKIAICFLQRMRSSWLLQRKQIASFFPTIQIS